MTDEPSVYLGNLGRCPALLSLEIRGTDGDARVSREVATLFSKTLQENPNTSHLVTPGDSSALATALYGAECNSIGDRSLPFVAAALGIEHAANAFPSDDERGAKEAYRIARAMKWDAKAVQELANKTCRSVYWTENSFEDWEHTLETFGPERLLDQSDADFLLTAGWDHLRRNPGDFGLFLRKGLLTAHSMLNDRLSTHIARLQIEREIELMPPSEGAFEMASARDWVTSTLAGVFRKDNNVAITGDAGEDCELRLVRGSVKVSSYVVSRRPFQHNYPVAWKILGSRDGENWFEIDKRQDTSIQETVVIRLPGRTCPVKAIRFVQKRSSDGGDQISLRYFDVFGLFKENATLNKET